MMHKSIKRMKQNNQVELLAPAGNMECLKTAFHFGADAVYLAGKRFGLRAFADNFSEEELEEAVNFAHACGKKVYVTVNALFRDGEFSGLEQYLTFLLQIGADAVIVSDPGVFTVARSVGIETHISTQMSTMNSRSATFWHEAGAKRIVLARENTLNEIQYISEHTPSSLELEVFIHGAMCVAHSGRCLLSSVLTGRSGNKGACAQPCRWEYTISEAGYPGQYFPIYEDAHGTYILNAKDLMMIAHIPELMQAGIHSFKIEGRMKSAYYVASVVSAYRKAINQYLEDSQAYKTDPELVNELIASGSRAFSTGFFFGEPKDAQDLEKACGARGYTFCAMVLEKRNADGMIKIEQRNRFFQKETLSILSPKIENASFTVEQIINMEGELQESAPHPQQHLWINCPYDLEPGDILRKEM